MTQRITAALLNKIERVLGGLTKYHHQCHVASLAIVKSGLVENARVARGFAAGAGGQHSWVALGDPYALDTTILDPTLWSYVGAKPHIHIARIGCSESKRYRPHGFGSIWEYGRPDARTGNQVKLNGLSPVAARFIHDASDGEGLDVRGWMTLANSPMGGWPAKEIITAMYRHKELSHLIPIDIVGMVTDENPGGLYLAKKAKAKA